jgi:RimJ/RimL family protein N-acetyltransferase
VLRGERIVLRGRRAADVDVLFEAFSADPAGWERSTGWAWRPLGLRDKSKFAQTGPHDRLDAFTVVDAATDEVLGDTLLWGVDAHHRSSHLGIALLASARGRGYGTEVLELLCGYAFDVRSLHRLQLETLADNHAMVGAARAAGFTHEGTWRSRAVQGNVRTDEVVYAILASEWRAGRDAARD